MYAINGSIHSDAAEEVTEVYLEQEALEQAEDPLAFTTHIKVKVEHCEDGRVVEEVADGEEGTSTYAAFVATRKSNKLSRGDKLRKKRDAARKMRALRINDPSVTEEDRMREMFRYLQCKKEREIKLIDDLNCARKETKRRKSSLWSSKELGRRSPRLSIKNCSYCSYSTQRSEAFQRHLHLKHGELSSGASSCEQNGYQTSDFACPHCSIRTSSVESLKSHIVSKHKCMQLWHVLTRPHRCYAPPTSTSRCQ